MKIHSDDPNLTAYALGELDEATRAELEQAINESPDCRRVVEDLQQSAALLAQELGQEACGSLSEEQRQAIVDASTPQEIERDVELAPGKVARGPWSGVLPWSWIAAAACLVLLLAISVLIPESEKSRAKARRMTVAELQRSATDFPPSASETRVELASIQNAGGNIDSTQSQSADPNSKLGASHLAMDPRLLERAGNVQNFGLGQTQGQDGSTPTSSSQIAEHRSKLPPDAFSPRPKVAPELMRRYGMEPSLGAEMAEAAVPLGSNPFTRYGFPKTPRTRGNSDSLRSGLGRSESSNTATYPSYPENPFLSVLDNPLSTFSLDVDTASYANVRRFLNQGQLPPRDAVRIEEMVNYFTYSYPAPKGSDPFAVSLETASSPWSPGHRLICVGLKAREIAQSKRPPSNLVFLIDVSGSMQPRERLPLIKHALGMLTKKLSEKDRVAIVVYASNSGVALPSTSGAEKQQILAAIDRLEAGGSTNGREGIQQAYEIASRHFIHGGVNRVILCTDGDFNVGVTDQNALVRLLQEKAQSGVFLSTLGVGTDNFKDALLQNLADRGNGNYHYLDTVEEAQKVLLEQMNGTLVTVAKDVKVQIEFNPGQVSAYRLIGYEKRLLRSEDFSNDAKDSGEVGAGHAVTALYEVVPAGTDEERPGADKLKYQPAQARQIRVANASRELLTLKLRYKRSEANESQLLEFTARDGGAKIDRATPDFKFAAAVAAFGLILRDSEYRGTATFDSILQLAEAGKGVDEDGYRSEFINLVLKAKTLGGQANGYLHSSRADSGAVRLLKEASANPQIRTRNVKIPVPLTREQVEYSTADPRMPGGFGKFFVPNSSGEIQDEAKSDKILANIAGTAGTRFCVARLSVMGEHPELINRLNENCERLLDVAANALSSATLDDIEKPGFRNNLRQQLRTLFNDVLGQGMVQAVIITEFVVQ